MNTNQALYIDHIVRYAIYHFACSECGAKPHKQCLKRGVPTKGYAHRPRFLAAMVEYKDDRRRRPYRRPDPPRPVVLCEVCGNPAEASWCASCTRRAFPRPGSSERWRYRKLRAFLLPYGITLARVYGHAGYYWLHFGRTATGPFDLDVIKGAVKNRWPIMIEHVRDDETLALSMCVLVSSDKRCIPYGIGIVA
jgi:hypothetical protein